MSKALIGLIVIAALIFSLDRFTANARVPEKSNIVTGQEVVLYATSWCGYCAKTRKFFEDNNILFTEYDIEKSSEGRDQYNALNGKGVPLLVVNGEVIRGYNLAAIERAMSNVQQ